MDRTEASTSWCPSGRADAPESVVLGVRSGKDGEVVYLADPVPAPEILPVIPEDVEPTRVLRFASHCVSDCLHRRGNDCTLVERVLATPAPGDRAVPRCHLRPRCRWWLQTGVEGCGRCPAVSTARTVGDDLAELVADPNTTQEQLDAWIAAAEAPAPSGPREPGERGPAAHHTRSAG